MTLGLCEVQARIANRKTGRREEGERLLSAARPTCRCWVYGWVYGWLDVHSYTLDDTGNNIYGVAYIREHLAGQGSINGYPVRCISPEWLVKFHTGYELDENDCHELLCERFGIDMPDQYRKFIRESS